MFRVERTEKMCRLEYLKRVIKGIRRPLNLFYLVVKGRGTDPKILKGFWGRRVKKITQKCLPGKQENNIDNLDQVDIMDDCEKMSHTEPEFRKYSIHCP